MLIFFSNFYDLFWRLCGSRLAGFWRSQLIRIHTVFQPHIESISIMTLVHKIDWKTEVHMGQNKILVLIAYAQKPPINAHTDVSSSARGLNLGQSHYLHLYFVYMSRECSGESVHLPRLVCAFVAWQCDKYQNHTCWPNFALIFSKSSGAITLLYGFIVWLKNLPSTQAFS